MNNRIVFVDVLRIAATFAVVVIHVVATEWYTASIPGFTWQVLNLYDSLARWCVPIFFMISGACFLDPNKNITIKDIYQKNILRILVVLVFWGTFYDCISQIRALNGSYFLSIHGIINSLGRVIKGPTRYHLWFLYSLLGVYMLIPVIRVYIGNCCRVDLRYIIVIFFVFGSIVPLINHYIPLFTNGWYIGIGIPECTGYIGYFIMGYYLKLVDFSREARLRIYILSLLSVLVTIVITSILSISANAPDGYFYGYTTPNVMITSCGVFILFKTYFSRIQLSFRTSKFIQYISSLTFGIYLIHDFFIQLLSILNINILLFNTVLSVPALSILVFFLSSIAVGLLKNIPIIKKYLV